MSSVPTPLVPFNPLTPGISTEIIFRDATIAALGIPYQNLPPATDDPAYGLVRIGWQATGQPFNKIDEDICYVRAAEEDNFYNRVRDRILLVNTGDPLTDISQDQYTRVWRVFWTLYGPASYDRARQIRSALFSFATHDFLAGNNLYLITDVSAPTRVPEFYSGRWWERVDFSAAFNEFVVEQATVQTVVSVEVIVNDADSSIAGTPLADLTIEKPLRSWGEGIWNEGNWGPNQ